MGKYPNLQPLGALTVTAPGTTTLLSANCGPLSGGTMGTWQNPPLPGSALRGVVLQAAIQNVGNMYLLPRASVAWSGSPPVFNGASIIAVIAPGQTVPIPYGQLLDSGLLPENFCLDADTAGNTAFGYGIF